MIYSFEGKTPKIHPSAFVSDEATIIGDVEIAEDANIWPGVVIRGDVGAIRIGERVNVQDGSVLHVDENGKTILEADVTIGHLAMVHGCHIESGCLIGMNATVLSGARIGKGSIIAGGAVVLEGQLIPEFSLAAGVPAQVKRELEESTYSARERHAAFYVELGKRAASGLVPVERAATE
ncbi:gamma carbonic anhydrase family protein [Corynebacterium sp. NML98-0116]|uniref:Gamma carbonic anhydrase family protein n=1 Tax=Corynebacterium lipophilum TaxID=2804918 RepID=A0AAW5HXC9_9CORY|nr:MULTISPECIES: gamma carbonic anhydrase family protein [Corynebacterium]AOX05629.1 gamma carbonic anhydrase family protein [Corynebacterium sp. NML98-0116]MCO6395188.1 gamma carbonic anhydrase family protein [Corynebacterium lipophilum]MCZ2117847.1 gamma carbonic anhydrase family protein [Corynebacterium lipophilum]